MHWRFWRRRPKTTQAQPGHGTRQVIVVEVRDGERFQVAAPASMSMDEALKRSLWLYAALTRNAQAASSVNMVVERRGQRDDEGRWVDLGREGKYKSLLDTPAGPVMGWTWQDLLELTVLQLYIHGRAAYDVRGGFLLPLPEPGKVRWDPDNLAWEYDGRLYRRGELVVVWYPGADGRYSDVSPLQAAFGAVSMEQQASERLRWALRNRVYPGMVYRVPEDYLTDAEQQAILQALVDAYQQSSKAGMPIVVTREVEIEPVSSYKDTTAELYGASKISREAIQAIFGIPPVLLGDQAQAKVLDYEAALRTWWDGHLFPLLRTICNQITAQFVRPRWGEDIRLWYDDTDTEIGLLRTRKRAELAEVYTKLGYPANVAARAAGLRMPYVEALDVPNVPWVTAGRVEPPQNGQGS